MRLKSLEIKGFKSFADKTVVNFDEGITGIIGPNGCGKSNIIDSIRWVIGEQKISALRSENLDEPTIDRLNSLYAKDYHVYADLNIIRKGWRKLGK